MTANLKMNLVSVSRNEAIINVNGQDYKFTIEKGQDHSWQDLTQVRDWKILVTHITEYFLEMNQNKKFDFGQVILKGDFSDLETTSQLSPKKLTLISATIKTGQIVTEINPQNNLTAEQQKRIDQYLTQLGNDFASIRPSLSAPISREDPPLIPPSEIAEEERIEDPRLQACENRAHSVANARGVKPQADFALAHQLKAMPKLLGATDYSTMDLNAVATQIRQDVASQIKNDPTWKTQDKFKEIFNALNLATLQDTATLTQAIGGYSTDPLTPPPQPAPPKKWFQRQPPPPPPPSPPSRITQANFNQLLTADIATLSDDEKAHLILIYTHYLSIGGKCLGDPFFKAFVEKHSGSDHFQITIIEENPATRTQKAISYLNPRDNNQVDTQRCAFLHFNTINGEYSSYSRASHAATHLIDLNTRYVFPASETRKRVPRSLARPSFPSQTIDATGRSLDKTLAYQIVKKKGENVDEAKIKRIADELRTKAAERMNDPRMDQDPLFFHHLCSCISHIPAFSNAPRYTSSPEGKEIKSLSKTNVLTLLGNDETELNKIQKMITSSDFHALSQEDKRKLREFYATYITYGSKDSSLDSAFLYVLPEITEIEPFRNGLQCAVIKEGRIYAQFPVNRELNTNDWLFVVWTSDHYYDSVNLETGAERLKEVIQKDKEKLLDDFLDALRKPYPASPSPEEIKSYLLNTLQFKYSTAFQALAGLIYDHDHRAWESSNRQLPEPGTTTLEHHGIYYDKYHYGHWRIHSLSAPELKTLLQNFSHQQIYDKILETTH